MVVIKKTLFLSSTQGFDENFQGINRLRMDFNTLYFIIVLNVIQALTEQRKRRERHPSSNIRFSVRCSFFRLEILLKISTIFSTLVHLRVQSFWEPVFSVKDINDYYFQLVFCSYAHRCIYLLWWFINIFSWVLSVFFY